MTSTPGVEVIHPSGFQVTVGTTYHAPFELWDGCTRYNEIYGGSGEAKYEKLYPSKIRCREKDGMPRAYVKKTVA